MTENEKQTDSVQTPKAELAEHARELFKILLLALFLCILTKGTIAEARFIPSSSMEPTLKIQDRILVEKVSAPVLQRPVQRGDIMVFYPPEIETDLPDNGLMGRFVPFLPESPPAFIKRVVGVPGDRIAIKKGVGVFINGKLQEPPPGSEPPQYDINKMSDIGGYSMTGKLIQPYAGDDSPVIVPPHNWFMLGDNRNNSGDSHVWGFVEQDRAVGRACITFRKGEWLKFGNRKSQ